MHLGIHDQNRTFGTITRKQLWCKCSIFPYIWARRKGAGDTDCVWGQTNYDREQAKTSRARATQRNNSFCTWQPPITSPPDSTSREQVCMTKSCIAAQVFAGQEQKVRMINHNHTHLWPPGTEKHLEMVHKHKLPHIPSAWVREQVLLSQWHSASQMEKKKFTEFWNKGLQLLETVLTAFTEHHSSKEEITTLSCASHVLHPLPAFSPWWYIHYGLTKVSLSDTSSLSHHPQKNLTEVQLHLCGYPALGVPPSPESGNGWYSHRRRISDLSGW